MIASIFGRGGDAHNRSSQQIVGALLKFVSAESRRVWLDTLILRVHRIANMLSGTNQQTLLRSCISAATDAQCLVGHEVFFRTEYVTEIT